MATVAHSAAWHHGRHQKLSVEKALNKLREADARQSKSTRRDEEIDALDEEIKRMRAQRLRLERLQRKKP